MKSIIQPNPQTQQNEVIEKIGQLDVEIGLLYKQEKTPEMKKNKSLNVLLIVFLLVV